MICVLLGIWETLWHGVSISGHDYIEDMVNECGCVQVLRCKRCEVYSVGWSQQAGGVR